jgi:hypothetical protein
MKKVKSSDFTHFGSVPFIRDLQRQELAQLQTKIVNVFKEKSLQLALKPNNPNLFHLTLSMLRLDSQPAVLKAQQLMYSH